MNNGQSFCTNCGAPLRDGVRFCTNCGSLADETAADSHSDNLDTTRAEQAHAQNRKPVVIVLLVAAVAAAGFWLFNSQRAGQIEDPPATTSSSEVDNTRSSSSAESQPEPVDQPTNQGILVGKWVGEQESDSGGSTYDVTLEITSHSSDGRLEGKFSGCGGQKDRCGSYLVEGDAAGEKINLVGTEWVERPDKWEMDIFDLTIASEDLLSGGYAFKSDPTRRLGTLTLSR